MAITYNWKVEDLEYSNDQIKGVSSVYWTCLAETEVSGKTYFANVYGQAPLKYDSSSENFISYENLTETQVLNWVYNSESFNKTGVENTLADQLQLQTTPSILAGKPWDLIPTEEE